MSSQTLAQSSPASRLARLDTQVRVAGTLLAAAPRAEQGLVAAMAGAATLAAWPLGGGYAFVAVPAALLLTALIRFHIDRLGGRREALAAAGAAPGDLAVIQAVGPLGGAAVGLLLGAAAALAIGRPGALPHVLVPLAVASIAVFLLRPGWVGAPALGAGAAAAAVASVAIALSAPTGPDTALVAASRARSAGAGAGLDPGQAAWAHGWLPAVVGLVVLAAAQFAVRRRSGRSQA